MSQGEERGVNKLIWSLVTGFGVILIMISGAALSKLLTISDRVADQAGDIKVILTNQVNQASNASALAAEVKELRGKVEQIERRQLEGRHAN